MHISNNIEIIVISFERAINRYFFYSLRLKITSGVAVGVKLIKKTTKNQISFLCMYQSAIGKSTVKTKQKVK